MKSMWRGRTRGGVRPSLSPRAALAAVVLTTFAGSGAARAEEPATWHAEALTSSPRGVQVTQYWSKGSDRLRAETVVAGHRLVSVVNGDLYYAIDVTSGLAIAVKRSPRAIEEGKKRSRLVGLEAFVIRERGGEKVKSEPLAGQMCDVYRLTDSRGRRAVWVQQERGGKTGEMLPLRVEVYNRQAGAEIRTDYVQWASGIELPDRLFLPDPRFSLEEFDYEEYVDRTHSKDPPRVPVLHSNLLHGEK